MTISIFDANLVHFEYDMNRTLVPILVLLVAVNSRFGLALPHQSIRLDPSDVPFIYNLNASWTETCPGGETDCAPGETCCPLKNQGKVL